ncbi:hypothetical protein [Microbacterium luticocti]|uniref:hypothetical protein n=1 Tax=Microbacterium luticocti TaxID=451764 RepID=UPI00041F63FE|nr:hypothetical protein [Microbacterium luticocti]
MGIQAQISVDGEIVAVHTTQMSKHGDAIPSGEVASRVLGDDSEHATAAFLRRLSTGATAVGQHADVVRATVKQNAQALRKIVDEAAEQEDHSVAWVRQHTGLIDQTAKTTTAADVNASRRFLQQQQEQQQAAAGAVPPASTQSGPDVSSSGDL